jgi:hypothetical protein
MSAEPTSDNTLAIPDAHGEDLTLLDDSLAIGKWELVETGLSEAKYNPEVAIRVCAGMKLLSVERKPLLYYEIPNRGRGLNVVVARALVSAVGNFETVEKRAELGEWWEPVVEKGEKVIHTVEAVRGIARVRDGVTNNVTMGVVEELFFGRKKDGWFPREAVASIARSKAERDARLDHFAAIQGALLEAIMRETTNGAEYFSGDPGTLRGSEATRESVFRQAAGPVELIGSAEGAEIGRQAAALDKDAIDAGKTREKGKLMAEFRDHVTRRYQVPKPSEVPASEADALREWIARKRQALGLNGATEAPPAGDEDREFADFCDMHELDQSTRESLAKLPHAERMRHAEAIAKAEAKEAESDE